MNYLTLDLPNGNLVLSDNSVWKSLRTWLNGGTPYSNYYDASHRGDYWKASEHWINIDSSSTYLSFTIEYDFVNASATDSCLCQIKYDGTIYGIAVTADLTGLNIQGATTVKHIDCDYSNANIKIDIVANLLTKGITTYIHKNGIPLIKVVNDSSSYTFTNFVIQAGAIEADTYKLLPTTTKLLNVSVSDDNITYSDFTDAINYVDKFGVAEIWANTKNYIAAQLLGKSDVGHTHTKSEITNFPTIPTKTSDLTNDSGFLTSHQDLSGYVPRSGGAVMTDYFLGKSADTGSFMLNGGTAWDKGGSVELFGANSSNSYYQGSVRIQLAKNSTTYKKMELFPNGTWTWNGSACAVSSDSRLKDEIESISDEILDAWGNLEPKQYKLKSELEIDKENAQVHYGWIAQDVESVIKGNRKNSVKNGLWLHEEWGEQKEVSHEETYTEEVETKSGEKQTVTKTRKVIDQPYRAKGDSYGLRYTECLVVECKYLRRCIARLTARIEELEKGRKG